MRLLLTRLGALGLKKHNIITIIDTDTEEIPFSDLAYPLDKEDLYSATGVVYSGNWLCVGVNSFKENKSYLLLFNFLTDRDTKLIELPQSKIICDIVSVFPGQLYICSKGTNTLNNISFSPDSGEFKSDIIHYRLPHEHTNFSSLCSHNTRWYGTVLNSVIELSNNRIIHSGLKNPHSLFFNSHNRLCFLDENKFYCGDDVFYFKENITTVYEDTMKAGYWLYTNDEILNFMNYDGDNKNCIHLKGPSVFKMIELRGILHEAF